MLNTKHADACLAISTRTIIAINTHIRKDDAGDLFSKDLCKEQVKWQLNTHRHRHKYLKNSPKETKRGKETIKWKEILKEEIKPCVMWASERCEEERE